MGKLILYLCFLIPFFSQAQERLLRKGDAYFEGGRFSKALVMYEKSFERGYYEAHSLENAAECLKQLKDAGLAADFYESLLTRHLIAEDIFHFQYAEALRCSERYEDARLYFSKFLASHVDDSIATIRIQACDSALKWKSERPNLEVSNLERVNSSNSDFAPAYYKDGLVFCSSREDVLIRKKSEGYNEPFTDLYVVENKNGTWGKAERFSSSINTFLHEGPATFSAQFDTIYFSRNGEGLANNHLKLFSAVSGPSGWNVPSGFMLNDSTCSFAHPSISKDGNLFFFSSNIPGGFGGTDIYVCIKADSNWSLPINLGANVNTSGNEVFPSYTHEGHIYFSSDGHAGMGGFDIFLSEQRDGEWQQAVNLKPPVNSGADDFSFVPGASKGSGYFSSSRPGGKGKDDLYEAKARQQ